VSFYAKSFVYDSIASENFNIEIANTDSGNGIISSPGSGKISILESYIYRRPVPFFLGIHFDSRLSFPVSFFSPDEINALDISYIQSWLFSKSQYKSLVIIQPDLDETILNCIFTDPTILRAGNIIYGISGLCEVNSQFAYTYPKTVTYNYSTPPSSSLITFFNNSHYSGYLYPSMTLTMNSTGGSVTIINASDADREFTFTSLSPNEILTINNDLGIVTSSLNVLRIANFNKKFLRFIPGLNQLYVTGDISKLVLTYQFVRRFGG
jgi:hypothetical protein